MLVSSKKKLRGVCAIKKDFDKKHVIPNKLKLYTVFIKTAKNF